jgi:hypothetical protein
MLGFMSVNIGCAGSSSAERFCSTTKSAARFLRPLDFFVMWHLQYADFPLQ